MHRLIVVSLLAALPTLCQTPEAMKKLDAMVGDWKGGGWIQQGPGSPSDFTGSEKVSKRLDGNVLLIEGKHYAKEDPSKVVHEAMALLSWDSRQNQPRMYACSARMGCLQADAKLIEQGLEWGFKTPNGTIRYTIDLSKPGQWTEIGEFSADGTAWRKFFEMKFEKAR